jgi:hypothetical protein
MVGTLLHQSPFCKVHALLDLGHPRLEVGAKLGIVLSELVQSVLGKG